MKRKQYSKSLKTKVAIAAIKGQKTANEIAAEFGVHVNQVNRWKKQALDSLPDCFGDDGEKMIKDTLISCGTWISSAPIRCGARISPISLLPEVSCIWWR